MPPSTNLVLRNNFIKLENKYWTLNFKPERISDSEIYEKLEELIFNSVRLRMRSDVPLAFCLSGGIDSSSLVAISNKIINSTINTFSIIDSDQRYDESENIQEIINFTNCKNSMLFTTKINFIDNMQKIISYYDAPIPTNIILCSQSLLSQKIKNEGFSVVISGTGADEIFTGYYDHYLYWLYEMRRETKFSELLKDMSEGYGSNINNPLLKDPDIIIKNPDFRGHLYQSSDVFQKILKKKFDFSFNEQFYCKDVLRNRMLNELSDEIVPVIFYFQMT